ncbi:MAG TPA: ribosome silencing factor [Planctomycetota bacterium]|nr:ribosome silencing factor [Planctomycetota bacterium]OQC21561.1 MAG: Ribosomal silencing factor RsfS [Planctomycetes bacterium ADurb.Bin069]NMD34618.1 ribosome silencing factor [Planctomycetota bacterium]HNR98573.1 ribosome silencing factor [Planctomycetota bacterium]HNU26118.1 ribosome silencing factor [Planctomycetota bacterium]
MTPKAADAARSALAEARERALACARVLSDARFRDISVVQVGAVLQVVDYFVIGTGGAPRQLKSAADALEERLGVTGGRVLGKEGYGEGRWVLLDCGDVVVHLMLEEARGYYDLDNLWGDCPRVAWAAESS